MNELDKPQNNLPATTNNFTAAPGGVTVQNNNGTIVQGIDTDAFNNFFGPNGLFMEQLAQQLASSQTAATSPPTSHAMEWAKLNRERYCLFVLENETYKTGSFSIPISKALKYTDNFTRDNLIGLSTADQEMIKNMPCIFAMKNQSFKKAAEGFPFVVGKVTEIAVQGENIKFSFVVFPPALSLNVPAFEQRILNENIAALKLKERLCRNQLDEEHWAIIENDLIAVGSKIGIQVY